MMESFTTIDPTDEELAAEVQCLLRVSEEIMAGKHGRVLPVLIHLGIVFGKVQCRLEAVWDFVRAKPMAGRSFW